MKIEIGAQLPAHFQPDWPGQYELFSHFEFACGIPQLLFAVTTYKPNGLPNVCPQSWSSFVSGKDGYYAILGGLLPGSHTYENILRERCFCVNFLSPALCGAMMRSIEHNGDEADEFAACGFTPEPCAAIRAPKIAEGFLTLECEFRQLLTPQDGALSLIVGRTLRAYVEEEYAHGVDAKYGADGFSLNVHTPIDLFSGRCDRCATATLRVEER